MTGEDLPIFDFNALQQDFPKTHVLIVGSTGSGKTNDALWLVCHAIKLGYSVLVIDPKAEYYKPLSDYGLKDLLNLKAGGDDNALWWNPLIPPRGVSHGVWLNAFSDIFTRSYGLSEPSRRILFDSVATLYRKIEESNGCYWPNMRRLERMVSKFKPQSPNEANSKRALENRLHVINNGVLGDALNIPMGVDVGELVGKISILSLGNVPSLKDQRFLVELLVGAVWEQQKALTNSKAPQFLIVLEEAHRYVSEERPSDQKGLRTLVELSIAEGRRYGISFVILDQIPSLLSRFVMKNCATKIVHRIESGEDMEVMSSDMAIMFDTATQYKIKSFHPGEALVRSPYLSVYGEMAEYKMPLFKGRREDSFGIGEHGALNRRLLMNRYYGLLRERLLARKDLSSEAVKSLEAMLLEQAQIMM
ncbi:MAG: ATP-binding protein [Candidatus Brockarchaeota archaeon]|nr:ATP-binding protein [Candidatus Brockarchaeota archaeon]